MPITALSAARSLCEMRGWSLTNLELQKILYLAHMVHLGRHDRPLVGQHFEAWDYGPVVPELYRHVRGFGRAPVGNVFHWVDGAPEGTTECEALIEAAEATTTLTAGQLVELTHDPEGAWAEFYRPGVRGIRIPNPSIREEYRRRVQPG